MERRFLATGETGSYAKSALETRIAAKTRQLPSLLQTLFDDVALLYHSGFLRKSEWEGGLEELTGIKHRGDIVLDRNPMPFGGGEEQTMAGPFSLGYEIGTMLRIFSSLSPRPVHERMLAGLMLEYANYPISDTTARADTLDELVSEVRENVERGYVWDADSGLEGFIKPTETPLAGASELTTMLNKSGIHNSPVLERYIKDNYFPDEPFHPKEPYYTEFIAQLREDTPIDRVSRLVEWLDIETNGLRGQKRLGVDVLPVITAVWESKSPTLSKVTQQIEADPGLVRQIANKLSAKNLQPDWVLYPIFFVDDGNIELTPYGELWCQFLFNREDTMRELHQFAVEPERVPRTRRTLLSTLSIVAQNMAEEDTFRGDGIEQSEVE
jgi:hypothetical protein